jgi:hypothetical protein
LTDYIRKYKKEKKISIKVVSSEDCNSVGDALREIYRMNLINADFILLDCAVISNMKIQGALNEHSKRMKESKNNIVTRIYKVASSLNYMRTNEDDTVYVINRKTNNLLQFESLKDQSYFSLLSNSHLLSEVIIFIVFSHFIDF